MPFDANYGWKHPKTIVMKHPGGRHIRVNPEDLDEADADGGKGKFAQWEIEKDGDEFKIKSKHTGKYLRLKSEDEVDVGGGGAGKCKFTIDKPTDENNIVRIQSVKFPGRYIAVRDGKVKTGGGGKFTHITCFKE